MIQGECVTKEGCGECVAKEGCGSEEKTKGSVICIPPKNFAHRVFQQAVAYQLFWPRADL
jgi:hypothetical protein